ncbi:MgtC/SapB family protein [Halovibrio sp. HP20-50]|uniref:MgtC/SapB family protein n=1 Tax=Halovibrio sp. HP20-59 TaxID=3080275 RepID=UPI00294B090A|nr:MgtC/SapB family protein [Halovibrio sp. HP20-59]MEA2118480.1 MgtC/SapB family protein [Halovibrio sp. HP20-59]
MHNQLELALSLLAALTLGLMIGVERGWSGREKDEGTRVAGVRTFSLIGLSGGIFAILAEQWGVWLIVTGFVVVAMLISVSYISHSHRSDDAGITTEFSMLLTFALAIWATSGDPLPALSCGAVVVAFLGHKKTCTNCLNIFRQKPFTQELLYCLFR